MRNNNAPLGLRGRGKRRRDEYETEDGFHYTLHGFAAWLRTTRRSRFIASAARQTHPKHVPIRAVAHLGSFGGFTLVHGFPR
jgi:hypothetical protein